PVCPETGGHFKAKWGDSLNAERLAIFAEMPNSMTFSYKKLIKSELPEDGKAD
ncbi:hypothetical protein HDC90_004700, partial [Pedobacter sp. AK013]|nr:hypothetical protein [Pedobacter sp. AK013]